MEGHLLVIASLGHTIYSTLDAGEEVCPIHSGQIVGKEGTSQTAALATYSCGHKRAELGLHHVHITLGEECLDAWIHGQILEHAHAKPVDRHLLRLLQMHALAHDLPSLTRVEVVVAGIHIQILKVYAIIRFFRAELLEHALAELTKDATSRAAKSNNQMISHLCYFW